jgi:glycosyltransferase involved in cell wall biosynthesis
MELCGALAVHGVEVVLAILGEAPTRGQRETVRALGNTRLEVSTPGFGWIVSPCDDIARIRDWLAALAGRQRVNILHLNAFVHGALPWDAPTVIVAHSCVRSWWQAVHGTEPPPEWDGYRRRVAAGLAGADLVVAPTYALLERLRRLYAFDAPCRVIHDGCTPELPPRIARPRQPIVFACGRLWDESKDYASLDCAGEKLPWKCFIAGDAASPDERRIVLRSLRPLGELTPSQITSWLHRSEIFVHPSLYEPFGFALLGAAHAGCALVLSDVPELRELWSDAAVFVPPHDPGALERALIALIADDHARQRLRSAARERATRYRPERMAEAYVRCYESLVRHRAEASSETPNAAAPLTRPGTRQADRVSSS